MVIVLTLGSKVMLTISAYGPQSERPDAEKFCFYDKIANVLVFKSSAKITFLLKDFNE